MQKLCETYTRTGEATAIEDFHALADKKGIVIERFRLDTPTKGVIMITATKAHRR